MCGICGAVTSGGSQPVSEDLLTAMRDTLVRRGPDDEGNYLAPGIALGSRRLSILDLSPKGHMPMSTADGRYTIVHNGEVYNFESLRADLISRGIQFNSGTDTEVLLRLYSLEGPAMLQKLNGMFAFAVWDAQERSLFIARDRLGVKPLYYSLQNGKLYFASEEKCFFAAGLKPEMNSEVLEELLYFRYAAGERTPYKGIKRLLPGHYLVWKNGEIVIHRWWNLSQRAREVRKSLPQDPEAWFQSTFDDAVKIRRISDVPVGVFLSGGLDSSSVAASMARQNAETVSGFTMGFAENEYDETPLARETAAKYGLKLHELKVSLPDVVKRLEKAPEFLDEPMAHASDLHLWMISEYAKNKATVLLSGEGADETMAGYGWYKTFSRLPLLRKFTFLFKLPFFKKLHPRFKTLGQFLSLETDLQMMLRNISETLPQGLQAFGFPALKGRFEFREKILNEARGLYPDEPVRQAMYYDQHTYLCSILDRNDKMTMAASIECRTPFLDYRLVEGLAAMPSKDLLKGKGNKPFLRRVLGGRLPNSVLIGRKRGFDVPWGLYMRENEALKERVRGLSVHPVWASLAPDRSKMDRAISGFLAGDNTYTQFIRNLVMITIWHDVCIGADKK